MRLLTLALLAFATIGCQPDASAQDAVDLPTTNFYAIDTPQGRIVVELFDSTPLHRDNFKRIVAEGVLDSTRFHRVIDGFMIQGGDPNSLNDNPFDDGQGGPGYDIEAELNQGYHFRGALAAAREGDQVNPERKSSGSQFYLVHGMELDSTVLGQMRERVRTSTNDATFDWDEETTARYLAEGGVPFLDAQYTVFGRTVEGFDVIDAIATMPTGRSRGERSMTADQPPTPVHMTVTPLPDYTPPPPSAEPVPSQEAPEQQ
jgi:peptidyl-prolyl cis-trans isomerase B (cyclophilin B)